MRHEHTCNSIPLSLTRVFIIDAMIEKHAQMNVATHICGYISIGEPSNYQGLKGEKKRIAQKQRKRRTMMMYVVDQINH